MYRKWLLIGMAVGFLVLLVVLILIGVGPAKRQSGTPASVPEATVASDWARSMLQKYPYEKGSYSGVLPTGKADEIWIIGKKASPGLYPNNYVGAVNDTGQYFAKIGPGTEYSTQVGDDFVDSYPSFIEPGTIIVEDDIAIRMTFVDNFPSALEVRRLVRVQPSD